MEMFDVDPPLLFWNFNAFTCYTLVQTYSIKILHAATSSNQPRHQGVFCLQSTQGG